MLLLLLLLLLFALFFVVVVVIVVVVLGFCCCCCYCCFVLFVCCCFLFCCLLLVILWPSIALLLFWMCDLNEFVSSWSDPVCLTLKPRTDSLASFRVLALGCGLGHACRRKYPLNMIDTILWRDNTGSWHGVGPGIIPLSEITTGHDRYYIVERQYRQLTRCGARNNPSVWNNHRTWSILYCGETIQAADTVLGPGIIPLSEITTEHTLWRNSARGVDPKRVLR